MIFSNKLEEAYRSYLQLLPLDLENESDQNKIDIWKSIIRYDSLKYARSLMCLCGADTIDDYVKSSGGDFDNLALVIKTAIDYSFVDISKNGTIKSNYSPAERQSLIRDGVFAPTPDLNQFPCDSDSADERAFRIISNYPFSESISVGLVGDDDFISLRFAQYENVKAIVVEKDERIINEINMKNKLNNISVIELDARNNPPNLNVDTFVTDPPYTFDGAMSFIVCGLKMLGMNSKDKQFFVVLNPTMMGMRLYNLTKLLASFGIICTEVYSNISKYKLPDQYKERMRANSFLSLYNIDSKSLTYSSNSSMYCFKITECINIAKIEEYIKVDRIYEHYE